MERVLSWQDRCEMGTIDTTAQVRRQEKGTLVLLESFFFLVFLPFLGPLLLHMEVPRLGV